MTKDEGTEDVNTTWSGEACGWPWPVAGPPPDGAECDNCGGEIVEADWRDSYTYDDDSGITDDMVRP